MKRLWIFFLDCCQPVRSRRHTEKQMLGDLLDRVFAGEPGNLVLHALASGDTTAQERQQIRQLLDELEEKGR